MTNLEHPANVRRTPRRGRGGPTVADVARLAGVSPMTVSRVINNEPNVIAATRGKVDEAIAALGYFPNLAARSLAGGRQCRVALLYSNPSAAYLSELLVGGLAEAASRNVELIVEHCGTDYDVQMLVARLVARRVDAVLVPPPLCDDTELLAAFTAAKFPMALIATGRPQTNAQAVRIDNEAAAHAMTARLISLGHRRIGFIAGNANQTASAERQAGHERALGEAGIPLEPALFAQGDFTYRSGLAAAEKLLDQKSCLTAIFASNDDMAAAAMAIAHRRRLDVPRELSICGFDDTAMATSIWPELTTIRQPISAMARRAIALVSDAVRADMCGKLIPPCHESMDFELVPRASDGKPPI